jgi:serine/threonine protein kinase/Tfp pilus assembly protein PilF
MIGQTISHYRILDLLGEGGMGAVYVAEDTRLGRRVAVKIPREPAGADNSFHARFLREARSISQLSHPNIATVHDFGETPDGQPFIVMELVEGRELGDLLREGGLTLARAVEIVCEVGEALSEAHLRGVVHRDVKPSNVVVNSRGSVKVLDFGLAKVVSEGQHAASTPEAETLMKFRTRSDVLVGTPLYLSPEQAKGAEVDARSDLFALGAVLYECVTGQPAFSGTTVMEIAGQVIHVNPSPPSSLNPAVPAELDRVTMKALAKRPEERYQSAGEMIEDLRRVRAQLPSNGDARATALPSPAARTVAMAAQPRTEARASALLTLSDNLRRPRLSLAAVLALLAVTVGAIWVGARMMRPFVHPPLPEAERLAEAGADYLREGAFWHAGKQFERAVELDPLYALAHARLAEAQMELDYVDDARESLLRVRNLVPDPTVLPERDRLYLEAVTSTATRDFSAAVAAYGEIARRWPEAASGYVDLGRAYERRGQTDDPKRATEAYLEATRRDPKYAAAYLRVANLYARQQQYDSAASAFDQAEAIYKDRGLAEGRAEVLYNRGLMLRSRGLLSEARAQIQQSLEIARTNGYDAKQVSALLQLSAIATNENDPERAAGYAREAVELAQSKGLVNLAALGFVDLANTYHGVGNYAEAEKHFKLGLEFARRSRAQRTEAKALINWGSILVLKGQADEGARLVEQALAFYQPGGYRTETLQAIVILARVNRQKGNYEEAMRALGQQLEIAQQVNDASQVALLQSEIAAVLGRQGRYAEALRRYEKSYEIDRSLGNRLRLPYTLINRADMLAQLGRANDARALLGELSPDGASADLAAEKHLAAAWIALTERRYPEARAESARALSVADKGSKTLIVRVKLAAELAEAHSGGARAARQAAEAAVDAARETGDPWLILNAQLAQAQVLLEAGDAAGALAAAREAQAGFGRAGHRESEWRAWLVAARASRLLGDAAAAREMAGRAGRALEEVQRAWGAEFFDTYQARPDVQLLRQRLTELAFFNFADPAGRKFARLLRRPPSESSPRIALSEV